jgi:phosphate:Na+ symporter
MILVGASTKLLAMGAYLGSARFALVLFALTTLQQGMGGLTERMHPAGPTVFASPTVCVHVVHVDQLEDVGRPSDN